MKRTLALLALGFAGPALAQTSDPALDDILSPDPVPTVEEGAAPALSELDELSKGSPDADFPDMETVQKRRPVSVTLRALDKIIAKYQDMTIPMDASAEFGTLTITARTCDKRPPEEFPETTAFVEITDSTPAPVSNLKIAPPNKKQAAGKVKSEPAAGSTDHGGAVSPAAAAKAAGLPANMIFSGWMFASSPALSALQHPVYDVWVIDCKTVKIGS
ncbi:MAG: DUF2155 domain-containing protein [Parvularculaceae bacterium]|nr:DUF2155 domain-containing protein [Parvularculaceae bacterium]